MGDPELSEGEVVVYACPMHPEVASNDPGSCPKCGMRLLATKAPATSYACSNTGSLPANAYLQEIAPLGGHCTWYNNSGGSISGTSYQAETNCCRVPGQ